MKIKDKTKLKKPVTKYSDNYPNIDLNDLLPQLRYDEVSGRLYRNYAQTGWKIVKRREHGIMGYVFAYKKSGVMAQDAVWLLHHGHWPKDRLIALDGDIYNTRIENLIYKSDTVDSFGKYRISFIDPANMKWAAYVWHYPFFAKKKEFGNKKGAVAWAEAELRVYNKYAIGQESLAKNFSETKRIPIPGIAFNTQYNMYEIKTLCNGLWKYHGIARTIEEAIEMHREGQAETDEVWGRVELIEDNNTAGTSIQDQNHTILGDKRKVVQDHGE